MKRVVITGFGIISSIGNTKQKVLNSLKKCKSGIIFSKKMRDLNLKSNVWAPVKISYKEKKSFYKKKLSKYMNNSGLYTYLAMKRSIKDANLNRFLYKKNPKVGLIVGSGCGYLNPQNCFLNIKNKNFFSLKRYKKDPYFIFKSMPSSISAGLSSIFKIQGVSYSISAACATSLHCIGHAYELIKSGQQNIIFSGGSEELTVELSNYFDVLGVLSKKFNNFPEISSRPYDFFRDGFVISEGSGILVLEEMSHAISRNARIYAEIVGYGKSSDGLSMFFPSKKGIIRCMYNAINKNKNFMNNINYINSHGTSTVVGDLVELKAIKKVFKKNYKNIYISSNKSIFGHSLGASGVHSIICIILMFENNFIFPNINIKSLDFFSKNMNLLKKIKNISINYAMSNNFGFGGNNSTLILKNLMD